MRQPKDLGDTVGVDQIFCADSRHRGESRGLDSGFDAVVGRGRCATFRSMRSPPRLKARTARPLTTWTGLRVTAASYDAAKRLVSALLRTGETPIDQLSCGGHMIRREPHQTLSQLAAVLDGMRDELVTSAAILQLIPENATKWARFERLLEVASSLEPDTEPKSVTPALLRQLLTSPPIATAQLISGEDPFEEPFVAVVTFYGGSYRVVSGGASAASAGCQLLLEAVRALPDSEFREYKARVLFDAEVLLKLSDAMCQRAGLARWESPSHSPRTKLVVPGAGELERLGRAVTFSQDDLDRLLGPAADYVGELFVPGRLGLSEHDHESPTDDRAYLYPLVQARSGDAIVALSSGLAASITHRALARAVEEGIAEAVVEALHEALHRSLAQAFKRVRWTRVQGPSELSEPNRIVDAFYRFDIDKLAHVVSVVDPLHGYTPGNPFGHVDLRGIQDELHDRFVEVRSIVREQSPDVSILHVVCSAPLGRSHFMGFTDEAIDETSALLAANIDDLDLMTRVEAPDPLALWKFARASDALHRQSNVVSFSKLDEYAIYRQNGSGYYMSDDPRPTMVSIQPGSAAELRVDERRRVDQHAVVLPEGGRVVDVVRWPADDATPVYRPDHSEFHAYHLVELQLPCWVVPSPDAPSEVEGSEDFAEAVAFWLWKCSPLISAPLEALSHRLENLVVTVRAVEQSTEPDGPSALQPVDDWLRCELDASSGQVSLVLLGEAAYRLARPDNEAERELAVALVEAIHQLSEFQAEDIRTRVELALPVGEMRMLQVLGGGDDLLLTLGHMPRPRLVPDADVEQLLDEVGDLARDVHDLAVGPIAPDDRTGILNSIVAELFARLMALVASLDPRGLLEYLSGEREAILFLEARNRLQLPSQAACFGEESSAVRQTMRMAKGLVSTALANRFLIECATARPPHGDRPLALSAYDRLLALAKQIVEYGFMSDAIRHELSSVEMSMLPSGRLGFSRDEPYHEALAAFRDVIAGRALRDAQAGYAAHWGRGHEAGAEFDPSDLNEAYLSEFGISATDLSHLSGDLIEFARSEAHQVASRPLSHLTGELSQSLGWPQERIRTSLKLLSLEELVEFPPKGNPADSYPWRYGRNRSAARRPLSVRSRADDPDVIWGPRAVYRSGRYLLDLVTSGRLKATSPVMKRYITSVRREGNDAFNRDVADFLRGLGYDDVRENVRKFGRFRLRRSNGEDLGDIDVLVLDRASMVLLAIEVKDFEFARTPIELSNEIDKLLEGPGSAAHHHGERLDALKANLGRALSELDLSAPPDRWQVRGLIVTSADLFAGQFPKAQSLAHGLKVMSYDSLRMKTQKELTGRSRSASRNRKRKKRRRRRRR